jgi:hypothetical protein
MRIAQPLAVVAVVLTATGTLTACNNSKVVAGASSCPAAATSAATSTNDAPAEAASVATVPVRPTTDHVFVTSLTPQQATAAGATAAQMLQAMDADPATFTNVTITGKPLQFATFNSLGSIHPGVGANFAWMSTGVAGAGTSSALDPTAILTQPGNDLGGSACGANTFDCAQLAFTFVVPNGLHSVAFDFNFMSTEYPEFVGAGYNDTFTVSMSSPSHSYANLVFDHNNNPINIDSAFFNETCTSLTGSGFDIKDLAGACDAGGTGLLTTQAPVEPGETVTLTLSIMDAGDGIYDSAVMLDNLRVDPDPVSNPNTDPCSN